MSTLRILVFTGLLAAALAATTTPSSGCTQNGHTYMTGESFQPSPCEHCFCTASGHLACAIADCFFSPCVDAVNDPTKCCPTCPNGENCRHQDGTIIKKGETYSPDANTVCECPTNTFGFRGTVGLCAYKAQAVAAHGDPLVVS